MASPWFPLYIGDYVRDTGSLSLAEHGAYLKLLIELYSTAKPLPTDADELHRICNAHGPAEQAAVDKVAKRFFVKSGGGLVQLRAMLEINKQQKISEKRRAAALKSHGLELALAPANAGELQTHPHPHPHPHPDSDPPPQSEGRGVRLSKAEMQEAAIRTLDFLNEKAGRAYQAVNGNMKFILARLKAGATEEQLRQVIAKKCREWGNDEKMAMYLRPATLFNETNFAQYQGELVTPGEGK